MAGIHCPSCERYIGPVEICPYCRAKVGKSRAYVALKYGSLVIAVLGILLLRQIAALQGVPQIAINDIKLESNYAYVEIRGVVCNPPSYFPEEYGIGSLYFNVDDGTGIITIKSYPSTTKEILAQNKIPSFGDYVKVRAQVQISGTDTSLVLQSANGLSITRADAAAKTISELASSTSRAFKEGERVKVSGKLESYTQYKYALSLRLSDLNEPAKNITIWIPQSIIELTGKGALAKLELGMVLEVEGSLKWYEAGRYSAWEVIPATTKDIKEV
ncbi:MAG: hypothetical protein AB1485_03810 [Candidatus Thermoplasmatota archaeon]